MVETARMWKFASRTAWALVALVAVSVRAQAPSAEMTTGTPDVYVPPEHEGVGVSEKFGGEIPKQLSFRDDQGKTVSLGDYFSGDKPVIMSLNYSSCPQQCSWQLSGMADRLSKVDMVPGKDYELVSVSIDPNETTERARAAKEKYAKEFGRQGADIGFHFLTGAPGDVRQLADALGISYKKVEGQSDYAHPSVFALVSPKGVISRYLYGVDFDERTLRLSLIEASEGKIGKLVDRFIFVCFLAYDDASGSYVPVPFRIMQWGMGATAVLVAATLAWVIIRDRRRARSMKPLTAT